MHKGESLLEKKVKKYYSFYFTGEELKLRDALLFIQGYNHLSDLLKELESTSSVLVCLNMQTLLYFYLVSYSRNLESTVQIHLPRELVFIDS